MFGQYPGPFQQADPNARGMLGYFPPTPRQYFDRYQEPSQWEQMMQAIQDWARGPMRFQPGAQLDTSGFVDQRGILENAAFMPNGTNRWGGVAVEPWDQLDYPRDTGVGRGMADWLRERYGP